MKKRDKSIFEPWRPAENKGLLRQKKCVRKKRWINGKGLTTRPNALYASMSYFFAPAWQQQVAKCFIFEPKIPMWVTFGGPYDVDIFYGHLVYFTAS
jgi:hypothetical protein